MIPIESLLQNALEATVLAAGLLVLTRSVAISAPLRSALWLLVLAKLLLPPLPIHSAGLSALCRSGLEAARGALEAPHEEILPEGFAPPVAVPAPWLYGPADPADAPTRGLGLKAESSVAGLAIPGEPTKRGQLPLAERAPPALAGDPIFLEIPGEAGARPDPMEPAAASPPFSGVRWGITLAWLAGLLAVAWRRARRVDALRALLREASDAPAEVLEECASIAALLGVRRPPRVRVVEAPISPLLWAGGRPVILLPAALASDGHRALLRSVLAHELAHVARGDHWTAWVELAATLAYWWLPTAWLSSRALERAADEAADALAAKAVASPREYAHSLLSTIELIHWTPLPTALPGRSLGEREAVRRRLTMLFRGPIATRLTGKGRLALIALAALVLPASPRPATSQESGDAAVAADEPAAAEPAEPAVPVAAPTPAEPAIRAEPRPADAAPAAGAPAPVALPAPAGGTRTSKRAPWAGRAAVVAGSDSGTLTVTAPEPEDLDARLRSVERRIEALLSELQGLRAEMHPRPGAHAVPAGGNSAGVGGGPAVTPRAARAAAVLGSDAVRLVAPARTSAASVQTNPATPAPAPGGAASSAGPALRAWPAPGFGGSLAPHEASPYGFPPPNATLTEAQRARIEELDAQYRERLERHRARYAREREEAIRLILEGKEPLPSDPTSPVAR